jgi:hypothetical protein
MAGMAETNEQYRCPRVDKCALFQQEIHKIPALIEKLKQRYCYRDNTRCARLWIANELGTEAVPKTLLPNQYDWAQHILCDVGKGAAVYQHAFPYVVEESSM